MCSKNQGEGKLKFSKKSLKSEGINSFTTFSGQKSPKNCRKKT
jgi:hypothetical protein